MGRATCTPMLPAPVENRGTGRAHEVMWSIHGPDGSGMAVGIEPRIMSQLPFILTLVGAIAAILSLAVRRRGVITLAVAALALAGATTLPAARARTPLVSEAAAAPLNAAAPRDVRFELAISVLVLAGFVGAVGLWGIMGSSPRVEPPVWFRRLLVVTALAGLGAATWVRHAQPGRVMNESAGAALQQR